MRIAFIKRLVVLSLGSLSLLGGFSAHADDLIVSAAASLTNAFTALGQSFEATHPNTTVILNFGASDMLMTQMLNGAPADVFASADQIAMDRAIAQKIVTDTSRRDFAKNQVVVIVPSDSQVHMTQLSDLADAAIKRVTYGNPAFVPIGRYAKTALEASGQWANISAKAVLAQNVRQSLDYVVRGEVDAGFVFATDAALVSDKVRVAYRVISSASVSYPIAVSSETRRATTAQAFIDYVLSDSGQVILAKYGFLKP